MPPNQATPPSGGHDPYAFIMQDAPKQKRPLLPSNSSRKQRMFIGVGLLGILVVFGIILTLILSSGGSSAQPLIEIAQTQNEIIRVSGKAVNEVKSTATLAFAQNTFLSTSSGQQQTLNYIATLQKIPDTKQLALGANGSTDTQLETASQAGRYDEVFYSIMYKQLVSYRTELSETFKSASGPKQKELLQKLYNDVTILLKNQVPPTN